MLKQSDVSILTFYSELLELKLFLKIFRAVYVMFSSQNNFFFVNSNFFHFHESHTVREYSQRIDNKNIGKALFCRTWFLHMMDIIHIYVFVGKNVFFFLWNFLGCVVTLTNTHTRSLSVFNLNCSKLNSYMDHTYISQAAFQCSNVRTFSGKMVGKGWKNENIFILFAREHRNMICI